MANLLPPASSPATLMPTEVIPPPEKILTPRWYPLRRHPTQIALRRSTARFAVVPAGRRSGKTELAKRKLIKAALKVSKKWPDLNFFAAAPTRDQAKRIYWNDLKALSPRELVEGKPSESELIIRFCTGGSIHVIGMDKPERMEGSPWNGGICDEYANMKAKAWAENIRPALADREGWCWLIGVPEGRNHYYDLRNQALADSTGMWGHFAWPSSEILSAAEIASLKDDMDELTYDQECNANFINFQGRIYYSFDQVIHHVPGLKYDPNLDLIFCFDFNVAPGVAAVLQEQARGTCIIGEVFIPRGSNTPMVCKKLLEGWGKHDKKVYCYGDATGGNPGSAKVAGSDWDLIRRELRPRYQDRLKVMVGASNPLERSRVNAVNSRLLPATKVPKLFVNALAAPHVVKDFEGVKSVDGGSGEIEKLPGSPLTHISDAIGYYVHARFPVGTGQGSRNF